MAKKGNYVLSVGGIAIASSDEVKKLFTYATEELELKISSYPTVALHIREKTGYYDNSKTGPGTQVAVSIQKVKQI